MLRHMLKSKIHRATITMSDVDYEGSIALGPELREAANLLIGEKVLVANIANGSRLETYVMEGEPGTVGLNGAAARLGQVGELVIIMGFCLVDDAEAAAFRPQVVYVDGNNGITRTRA